MQTGSWETPPLGWLLFKESEASRGLWLLSAEHVQIYGIKIHRARWYLSSLRHNRSKMRQSLLLSALIEGVGIRATQLYKVISSFSIIGNLKSTFQAAGYRWHAKWQKWIMQLWFDAESSSQSVTENNFKFKWLTEVDSVWRTCEKIPLWVYLLLSWSLLFRDLL